jgi:hypothetical protein
MTFSEDHDDNPLEEFLSEEEEEREEYWTKKRVFKATFGTILLCTAISSIALLNIIKPHGDDTKSSSNTTNNTTQSSTTTTKKPPAKKSGAQPSPTATPAAAEFKAPWAAAYDKKEIQKSKNTERTLQVIGGTIVVSGIAASVLRNRGRE